MMFFFILVFLSLARQCAQLWLKTREMLGFPLGFISEPDQSVVPKDVLKAACEKVSFNDGSHSRLILRKFLETLLLIS
jgi:hypothetical protein